MQHACMLSMSESDIVRFRAKIAAPNARGCCMWTAARSSIGIKGGGHGVFGLAGRNFLAHRIAWFLEHGDPGELCVLHECDEPQCCNVSHLWLGTQTENNADKYAKGRARCGGAPGILNVNAKLDDDSVREIRSIYATGEFTQKEIASIFSVSHVVVSKITRREAWTHVE